MSPKNNNLVISGNGMQLSSVIIGISSLHSPAYTNLHNLLLALVVVSFELNSQRKKNAYEGVGEEMIRRKGAMLDNKNL